MISLKSNKVLVQIGTNTGMDDFNALARGIYSSKIVLVEPNAALNNKIHGQYKGVNNYCIENVAITKEGVGQVTLVHPKNVLDKRGNPTNSPHYTSGHFSILPMDDWGDNLDTLQADTMTFVALCEKHSMTEIHYLQIDAEGYDCEIIKSIDFKRIHIDAIKFEDWSFPEDCFKKYGIEGKQYGTNAMQYVEWMLINMGYTLCREGMDILAVKNYKMV